MRRARWCWAVMKFVCVIGNGGVGIGIGAPTHANASPGASLWTPATSASPSLATGQFALQVLATGDHLQQPFAIVDKRAALLTVFGVDGQLLGSSPVLLGRDRGDHSVPGVGDRAQTRQLRPGDATTPAGRFQSAPGHNNTGESVVWLDHGLALAIHRLRPGATLADRAKRLTAHHVGRKRISAGCVVVPVAFYERVVQPLLGRQPGVVYVLPERGLAVDVLQPVLQPVAPFAAIGTATLRPTLR